MQAASVPIDETFLVAAAPEVAWRLITDPAVVVRCMPGAEILGERDDGTLLGALKIKLGPTTVAFKGEVTPDFAAGDRTGSLAAQGADAQGRTRARATANFAVTPGLEGAGTAVALTGQIEVSGPLAQFARTGGVHLTRRMVAEFSANLAAHIEATAQPEPAQAEPAPAPPGPAPVSAFRLIIGVARDMARDLVSRVFGRDKS
jgi:carbon monoxide dehydrogenase subunit G